MRKVLNQIAERKIDANLYELAGFIGNSENFREMRDESGKFGLGIYLNDGEGFKRINLWGKRAHYAYQHFVQAPKGAFLRIEARKFTYRDRYGKFRKSFLPVKIENLHEYNRDPFAVVKESEAAQDQLDG